MAMMKSSLIAFCLLFTVLGASAQTLLKGRVLDDTTEEPLPAVAVYVRGGGFQVSTDANGYFSFDNQDLPLGEQTLVVEADGYFRKSIPVVLEEGETLNLDPIYLRVDNSAEELSVGIISLTENELADDENAANNISGLLQSSRDIFLRAAAFDFSSTFFRPRGLNSEDGRVLINGLEMNKLFDGRPQWSNWGGLNDLTRNQVFTMNLAASERNFGGPGGVQFMNMRASEQRDGTRFSLASANRSYQYRVMATHATGLMANGWAFAVSASRRGGEEGFVDGTFYDANSVGLSVEKKLGDHFINFTGLYTPNRRGRRTAITEEIKDLKGIEYNPFWGIQNGEIRNAREREIIEPIVMLNHNWQISDKVKLNTNAGLQFGKIGNTRIDNGGTDLVEIDGQFAYIGGARNPNPDYYQNLPSFFLRNGQEPIDYYYAYLAEQAFINDGQLDWDALYEANRISRENGGNAIYVIQEDRQDDTEIKLNSIVTANINENIIFNGNISYRNLRSENFAELKDLLGGTGYLDVDFFAEEIAQDATLNDLAQSDVRNPNRIVREGDRYKYNYDINAEVASAFAQSQFTYKKVDFFLAGQLSNTTYQRDGKYENGNFLGNQSFGESEKLDFLNYSAKAGVTYKISGQQFIDVHGAYITSAPTIRNSFVNARQNNFTVPGLESIETISTDVSYIYRSPSFKARLTGYYAEFNDGSDVGFYFTEDLTGLPQDDGSAFVQEVMTNIDRRNVGLEWGAEYQVTPTIKIKTAGSLGQNIFTSNPNFYLFSDDFTGDTKVNGLRFGDGTTKLENYHVAGGPETAVQLGFEYRDPDYWWVGATANYFANGYADVSALRRSGNFALDYDGQVFPEYSESVARELLEQPQFGDYYLFNLVGGKSWKIGDKYIGFFMVINNLFNQEYISGGFEQSRNSNFRSVRADLNNPIEVFAPRFFYGNGTTYYANLYFRF